MMTSLMGEISTVGATLKLTDAPSRGNDRSAFARHRFRYYTTGRVRRGSVDPGRSSRRMDTRQRSE